MGVVDLNGGGEPLSGRIDFGIVTSYINFIQRNCPDDSGSGNQPAQRSGGLLENDTVVDSLVSPSLAPANMAPLCLTRTPSPHCFDRVTVGGMVCDRVPVENLEPALPDTEFVPAEVGAEAADKSPDNNTLEAEEQPPPEPSVGMVFPTLVGVKEFYQAYGFSRGFGVISLKGSKGDDGARKYSAFACECVGHPDKRYLQNCKNKAKDLESYNLEPKDVRNPRRRVSKKCCYTAMIRVSRNKVDQWVIKKVASVASLKLRIGHAKI